jgi:hypothetical protein
MAIEARLQIASRADRRGWKRRKLSLGSSLQTTGEAVVIHDVSSTGMLIETSAQLSVVGPLEIDLPEAGITQAFVVWNSGQFYGCEFKQRIPQAAISAAMLRSPPASPLDSERSARPPLSIPELAARITLPSKQTPETQDFPEEEKAPFGVRLRVILGSAILLWTLIIWGAVSLYKLLRM